MDPSIHIQTAEAFIWVICHYYTVSSLKFKHFTGNQNFKVTLFLEIYSSTFTPVHTCKMANILSSTSDVSLSPYLPPCAVQCVYTLN